MCTHMSVCGKFAYINIHITVHAHICAGRHTHIHTQICTVRHTYRHTYIRTDRHTYIPEVGDVRAPDVELAAACMYVFAYEPELAIANAWHVCMYVCCGNICMHVYVCVCVLERYATVRASDVCMCTCNKSSIA
jgi:hypothetical protein